MKRRIWTYVRVEISSSILGLVPKNMFGFLLHFYTSKFNTGTVAQLVRVHP